ncbi:MAG TPA: RidA family protein [Candidatus Baltobacteraceae bacterium]|jgi:enamine deaminase RidA (YjgF/YER057c/UK114 family)
MSITRIGLGARMSKAVRHGYTIYLAGQVPDDANEDVAGQTRQVLAKIDAILAEVGTDKSHLLSATIYLRDIATFNQMNGVWDAWVDPKNTPARATVEAKLARPEFGVEISVIAATKV